MDFLVKSNSHCWTWLKSEAFFLFLLDFSKVQARDTPTTYFEQNYPLG